MNDDNNTPDNVAQIKQTRSFKDLVSSATNEASSSKVKEAQTKVKEIIAKKLEAEKLIRLLNEELEQLGVKFEKGIL